MSNTTYAIATFEVDMQRPVRQTYTLPRIYVWPDAESILQNLTERRNRPVAEWQKLVFDELVKRYGEEVRKSWMLKWSQKAGCRCGCSPGFILSRRGGAGAPAELRYRNVHINVFTLAQAVAFNPSPSEFIVEAEQQRFESTLSLRVAALSLLKDRTTYFRRLNSAETKLLPTAEPAEDNSWIELAAR